MKRKATKKPFKRIPPVRTPGLTRKEVKDRMFEQAGVHLMFLAAHDHIEHCHQFGCGRKLSLREKLFGNYCQDHAYEIQKAKAMIEHLNYNDLGEREVFLYWNDRWYRIPFYVLKDIADVWQDAGRKAEAKALLAWLSDYEFTHKNSTAILQLREILQDEMVFMAAYEYFTDKPLTSEPDEDDRERIEEEKFMEEWFRKNYPENPQYKSKTV